MRLDPKKNNRKKIYNTWIIFLFLFKKSLKLYKLRSCIRILYIQITIFENDFFFIWRKRFFALKFVFRFTSNRRRKQSFETKCKISERSRKFQKPPTNRVLHENGWKVRQNVLHVWDFNIRHFCVQVTKLLLSL